MGRMARSLLEVYDETLPALCHHGPVDPAGIPDCIHCLSRSEKDGRKEIASYLKNRKDLEARYALVE